MDTLQVPSDMTVSARGFQMTANATMHLAVVSCKMQWLFFLLPTLGHISLNQHKIDYNFIFSIKRTSLQYC